MPTDCLKNNGFQTVTMSHDKQIKDYLREPYLVQLIRSFEKLENYENARQFANDNVIFSVFEVFSWRQKKVIQRSQIALKENIPNSNVVMLKTHSHRGIKKKSILYLFGIF